MLVASDCNWEGGEDAIPAARGLESSFFAKAWGMLRRLMRAPTP